MRTVAVILLSAALTQAEPLDRIAVTVDTQVITESAVILDLRIGAFLDRAPVDLSGTAKRRAAERLVDQALVLREATDSHLALPTAQNAAALLNSVKEQFGPQEFQASLKRYGIEEADLAAQLLAGLTGITFTDLRFRPAVQVSEEDLRAYFETLPDAGNFEDSRGRIEELLTRQRTTDALDAWLITARSTARIQFREQVFQ